MQALPSRKIGNNETDYDCFGRDKRDSWLWWLCWSLLISFRFHSPDFSSLWYLMLNQSSLLQFSSPKRQAASEVFSWSEETLSWCDLPPAPPPRRTCSRRNAIQHRKTWRITNTVHSKRHWFWKQLGSSKSRISSYVTLGKLPLAERSPQSLSGPSSTALQHPHVDQSWSLWISK